MNEFEKRKRAWDRVGKEIQELKAENERLRQEQDVLLAALQPFAIAWPAFEGGLPRSGNLDGIFVWKQNRTGDQYAGISANHLKAAHEVITQYKAGTK